MNETNPFPTSPVSPSSSPVTEINPMHIPTIASGTLFTGSDSPDKQMPPIPEVDENEEQFPADPLPPTPPFKAPTDDETATKGSVH